MQYNQSYYAGGNPYCMQFYPCATPSPRPQTVSDCSCPSMYPSYNEQAYNGPFRGIVGEGDVSSIQLPDGSVQWFFIPATAPNPRFKPCMQCPPGCTYWNNNANNNGIWFVRSVNHPVARQECHQQLLPQLYGPKYNSNHNQNYGLYNDKALPPCPEYKVKFHADCCTSTEDIGYFCPIACPLPPTRSAIAVQSCRDGPYLAEAGCQTPCDDAAQTPTCEVYVDLSKRRRCEKRKKQIDCECSSDSRMCSSCERNEKSSKKERYSNYESDCSLCKKREKEMRRKNARLNKKREKERRNWERKKMKKEKRQREKERRICNNPVFKIQDEQIDFNKNTSCNLPLCIRDSGRREMERRKCNNPVFRIQNEQIDYNENTSCNLPLCIRDSGTFKAAPQSNTHNNIDGDCCADDGTCLFHKLGSAVDSAMRYVTSSISSLVTSASSSISASFGGECTKCCPKPCNVKLQSNEAERKKEEKELQNILKAKRKQLENEMKICAAERKKSEKQFKMMLKAEDRKSYQELKRSELEIKNIEKQSLTARREEKIRKKEQRKLERENRKRNRAQNRSLRAETRNNGICICNSEHQCVGDNSLTVNCQCIDLRERDKNQLASGFLCTSKQCGSANGEGNEGLRLSDHCCTHSKMSIDNNSFIIEPDTKYERCQWPSQAPNIPENPCQDCDRPDLNCGNLCNIVNAANKFSAYLEKASSAITNDAKDSQKHCGVSCEDPIRSNKQIATCRDQSNSGIFAGIMKTIGIGGNQPSCPRIRDAIYSPPPLPSCDDECSLSSLENILCIRR